MIKMSLIFCIFIILLPACANDYAIKYYSILDGNHGFVIFRFDNIRQFREERKPKTPNQLRSIYKVLTKNNKPLYAEHFNSEGGISSIYQFNSQGRIIRNKYLNKDSHFNTCLSSYNEKAESKIYRCYNEQGQQIEHLKIIYKSNLKFKTISFDANGEMISYFIFNYDDKKITVFDNNDTLIKTIDISQHL